MVGAAAAREANARAPTALKVEETMFAMLLNLCASDNWTGILSSGLE